MSDEILAPETKIETIVSNRATVASLKKKGVNTVGDLNQAASARVASPLRVDEKVDESDNNIVLRCDKFPGLLIRLLPGQAKVNPVTRSMEVTAPVVCEFHGGAATISRKQWLLVKHERDERKVNEELMKPVSEAPWRNEAVRWLRQRKAFAQGDFQIVE